MVAKHGLGGAFSLVPAAQGLLVFYTIAQVAAPGFKPYLRLASDRNATFLGPPVVVPDKTFGGYFAPLPKQQLSYVNSPFFGVQHKVLDVSDVTSPKVVSTSPPLMAKPRNPDGSCYLMFRAVAGGSSWVGMGDMAGPNAILIYNVDVGGKPAFPDMQTIATSPYFTCFCDVATDGQRFLAVWGEEPLQPGATWRKMIWRGQVFGLDGKPLGPAQDLALPTTVRWPLQGLDGVRGKLIFEGSEFVLFYLVQSPPMSTALHMARLKIQTGP